MNQTDQKESWLLWIAEISPSILTSYPLRMLATLRVLTCEGERSFFSLLNRIKSYFRNSMENECLTRLALLPTHYPVTITAEEVFDTMARKKRQKIAVFDTFKIRIISKMNGRSQNSDNSRRKFSDDRDSCGKPGRQRDNQSLSVRT